MNSNIFLDESGDLGFSFLLPYRSGGSSRFLTIGYLICPIEKCQLVKRVVRTTYKKFGFKPNREKKATELKDFQKDFICQELISLLNKHPEIQIGAITVKKERVLPHIRRDPNKLYNYMIRLSVLDKIDNHISCELTRDERSIKVASGNSCIDYLQSILWFDRSSATDLIDNPLPSHHDEGLMLADWITNFVWSRYENGVMGSFTTLSPLLKNQTLFF